MADSAGFAHRLRLALKALSLSRGAVAAGVGVDKSLVGRWAAGAVRPGEHNLARLTEFIAGRKAGFTMADWDRDVANFATLFGLDDAVVAGTAQIDAVPLLPPRFVEQSRHNTAQRGAAYEGFWRTTRPSVIMDGRFFHDHGMVRIDACGLLSVRMGGAGLSFEGWMLPAEGSLFAVLYDATGGTPLFLVFRSVPLPKAERLEGLLLLSALNAERTPAAVPVLLERIGDLTDDLAADDAHCAQLCAADSAVDGKALPADVRRFLLRDIGPEAAQAGGELFLTASTRLTRGFTSTGQLRG